jgi:hypothetical protein
MTDIRKKTTLIASIFISFYLSACGQTDTSILPEVEKTKRVHITNERIFNDEASIPPQCYTRTEQKYNPCYTCHQLYDRKGEDRLNQLDDGSIQGSYIFSDIGVTNHWSNLFEDRSQWLKDVDDQSIRKYVATENYQSLPKILSDSGWTGFIPDLTNYHKGAAAFDANGLALDDSGWVAFNYKPFPGTFWPTNGSTDDVVIRLPKKFRELNGQFNRDIYFINLTLTELNLKNIDSVNFWNIDESEINADLNGDGKLSIIDTITKSSHYLGDASDEKIEFQQFPQGTEFMHSVRYVGTDIQGNISIPARMKELRYMRKVNVLNRYVIDSRYANERKEKLLEQVPNFIKRGDEGLDNGLGWFVQGFIEDYNGDLRPQSYEETMFCMGCHAAIGTTIDSTFSMARKVSGSQGWGYINLHGMKDAPNFNEEGGEILNYLQRAGGGSEFRSNPEIIEKWYKDGTPDVDKIQAADVYALITPSMRRALDLNKAYSHIVRHQSFINGRDATWSPVTNVYKEIDESTPPLDGAHRVYHWDMRLNWD